MPHNFVRMSTSEEKRICEGVSDKLLDSRVSDVHIAEIATDLVDWELLAPGISLTQSEQKEIREDFEGRYNLQKRQALRVWRWKNGDKATYRQLIGVCCGQGKVDLAESIVKYLGPEQRPRSSLVLNDTFYRYLLDCYSVISHPSIKQWPSKAALHINIPHAYFDLILYDAPLNIPNSILPSNESCFKAVTLHDALTKSTGANRLLVYFEGIAGSGKTTLSWHACREWGQKRILQHFKLLIHIELSNPKVKEATNLADIIPYPDEALRQTIATEIVDRKGEGICLLLDGLDEAPTPLLDFLLVDLIRDRPGTPQVPNLSFVMTARPDSRVTERLEPVLDSRVIIKGFNGENLHQFLDQSLGVDTKMRMKLKEKCEINPKLEGLCSLPINAVIMSFLIHCIEDVGPATQTDLYKPFVSNFLVRHLDVHQALAERPLIECLLNDVPVEICGAFKKNCSLAYHSSLEGKQLFTKRELGQSKIDIDNTLGLLQVHPQITMYGSERYYKFFHLSLQEFLAAVYLSKKNENAQITAIDEILNKNPLSQVLHFYAGLTRLSNRQALKLLSQSLSQSADLETIRRVSPHSDDPHSWPSAKALTFLNCLYESQNKDVFNLPETYLCSNPRIREEINKLQMQTKGNLLREDGPGTLTLAYLPLTPIDCLSIGYYARINSLISRPSVPLQCYYLSRCSIDHIGISALFTELKKDICQCTPGRVGLSLTGNTLHHVSLPLLKDLLQGQSNLEVLMLSRCFLPADLHCALKYLTEGLSKNSSCRYITLSANYLSTSHVHHLILMLRANPQLRSLDLSYQDLRREMHLLWKAIQLLPNLRNLNMDSCNIHDPELALLQKVVESHHKLSDLSIYGNHFTDRGLDNLLEVLKCNHTSSLSRLGLGVQLNEAEEVILREINEFRAANGHRLLTPTGFVDAKLAKEYESTLNEFRDKNLMSDPREHLLVMTTSSSLPSTNVGNQGYCYVSAASTWDLQGVEICGETSVVVYSSRAQQFEWEGFGLKLYIHEGSLPVGMEQCILQIKASLAGLYEFPEDSHLISAVFWFRCKTVHKFIKPITVEIQHCAKAKNISELNFVRAFCSQKQLPYTFKQIAGGNFKSRKSCGVIDLTSFSGIAAIQNKSEERDYCSIVFYHGERRVDMYRGEKMVNIFYVIVWNTEAHLNVSDTLAIAA